MPFTMRDVPHRWDGDVRLSLGLGDTGLDERDLDR